MVEEAVVGPLLEREGEEVVGPLLEEEAPVILPEDEEVLEENV